MDIKIEELDFSYPGKTIFHTVNAELSPGALHYLAGGNGTGKSTMLKLLCGYLKPQKGRICLDGVPLNKFSGPERARTIGVLHQNIQCELDFSVREMIPITAAGRFPRWGKIPPEELERIENVMKLFELKPLEDKLFRELSGGERQRVLLAGLWVLEPAVMLLDEPTSALDPAWRNRVIALLEQYALTHTVLIVTHDPELLGRAKGGLWLLTSGNDLLSGKAEDLLDGRILSRVYNTPVTVEKSSGKAVRIFFDQFC